MPRSTPSATQRATILDSYWYVIGYCHFALGEHEQALEMCRKVAEHKRTDKRTGREVESPNKWQAIYILGQVYHSLGKAAEAIARVHPRGGALRRRQAGDRLLHAQGDRAAGSDDRQAGRAGRGGAEVPQRGRVPT